MDAATAARASRVTVGLALVFAAIGCIEFATGHLLITNEKVVEANDLLPYFRVNSLFFDPNIYGRYLALTMVLLAAVLLWTRRRREASLIAPRSRCCGPGSCSRSRSRASPRCCSASPCSPRCAGSRGRCWRAPARRRASRSRSCSSRPACSTSRPAAEELDRTTSGRANLIEGGLRMVRDRPVLGYGSGAYAEQYRERERSAPRRSRRPRTRSR